MTVQLPKNDRAPGDPRSRKPVLKATLRRTQLLQFLQESERRHLSADEILRLLFVQGVDITLATIYRVLSDLEDAGLVKRQVFQEGKAVFEINKGEHHDHLICTRCGRIDECHEVQVMQVQRKIARNHGYQLKGYSLVLYGLCANCK